MFFSFPNGQKPRSWLAAELFFLSVFLTSLDTLIVCLAAKNDKPLVFVKYEREHNPVEQLHTNICAYTDLFNIHTYIHI